MGFKLFFAGLLFLANPNVNMLDIIPDFIGLGMMWIALGKLRDLAPDMADCRRGAAKLFWLEFAKAFVLVWLILFSTDSGFLLPFSFGFTILELMFYIPMLSSFFSGMLFLGTRYNSEKSLPWLEGAKKATLIFIIAREILTFLPELTYLYIVEGEGYILEPYKGVIVFFSVILQFIFAVIWLIYLCSYRNRVIKDIQLQKNLIAYYNENILPDTNRFTRRSIKSGLVCLTSIPLLSAGIYIDGKMFIPLALSAVACLIMIHLWRKHAAARALTAALSALFGVFSIFSYMYGSLLADKYYFLGVSKSIEAYQMFIKYMALSAVTAVLFLVMCICIACVLSRMIDMHTGVEIQSGLESVKQREREKKASLRRLAIVWAIFAFLAACSSVASAACLYLWQPYWMIDIVLHLIWFCITLKFVSSFTEQLENKYM